MILNILSLLAVGLFVSIYTKAYIATDKTLPWYKRIYTAFKTSATVAWSVLVVLSARVMDFVGVLADHLDAGAGSQIISAVKPEYVAATIIGIMLISTIARLRTLWMSKV